MACMAQLIRTLNTVLLIFDSSRLNHQCLRARMQRDLRILFYSLKLTTEVHFIINVALFNYHNINQQSNLKSQDIISQYI